MVVALAVALASPVPGKPGQASPPPPAACKVVGRIVSSGIPLPGVALTAVRSGAADALASSTAPDGTYRLDLPAPGTYVLRAQLSAFTEAQREVTVAAEDCQAVANLELMLMSRAPAPAPPQPTAKAPESVAPPAGRPNARPRSPAAPGSRASPPGRRFQGLSLTPDAAAEGASEAPAGTPDASLQSLLPPGFAPDAPTDSVAMTGTQVQTVDSLLFRERLGLLDEVGGDLEALRRRMAEGGLPGAIGFGGGPGGPGGMGPGPGFGGGFRGGPGGMGGANRLQGSVFYTLSGSALDANPYALNGKAAGKAEYLQNRFGATVGGPLKIPGVYDGKSKTSFFLTYSGNRSSSPHDAYSTLPTAAERGGDLSGREQTVVDPLTGQPFPGNVVPAARIGQAARTLLEFIPLPNAPGSTRNYHYVTAVTNRTDEVSLRLSHAFGSTQSQRSPRAREEGMRGPGGPGGPGGLFGRRRTSLNAGLTYRSSSRDDTTSFPTLGGTTRTSSWDVPISFSFARGRLYNQIRLDYNRNRSDGLNLYAYGRDVAGEAGINGVSRLPFDWGVPNLSFTTIADLRDRNPAMRLDQRIFLSDTLTRTWGRHTVRLGGDFRWQRLESRTDANARGSFVFTGAYTARVVDGRAVAGTGLDFADFLLGLPQQASVQYGPGRVLFHTRSWSLFLQDDWRLRGNLTLNLGLRYESVSPFEEQSQRLANLDVTPDFTAAAPVLAGEVGPYSGPFPDALVYADRNNLAPRVGVAWKPRGNLTVRSGFGVNYNLGAYGAIAQRLSGQPPFAVSSTSLASRETPLTLSDPFAQVPETTTTNSFGIDKRYQLGSVAIWNLDVQREVRRSWILAVGYTGTRGWNLDLQRAPNRGPTGLRIPDVVPFLWQSSQGHSIMHSLTARVRKRFAHGVSFGATYTFAKAIDDASSIGGGAMVVAQNDQDLAAERGRSSFDRRHRFSADYLLELPFGPNRRWMSSGLLASVLGGWTWNGSLTVESGPPFTARVVGDFADVARGVNGTLRADVTGEPIDVDDPTTERWFNTGGFVLPPPGAFGSAGRNTITGPGTCLANMGLTRNVALGGARVLSIRVQASNVFNTPQFTTIDTVVNSPTYGQVVAVGPMRSVQVQTRLRF